MAIKKNELYSSLWASCDKLRGGMDASQYKDYILTLLFVKYVTDKFGGEKYADVIVPQGGSFDDMVNLKGKKDIGEGIDKIIAKLAEANELTGIIDNAHFNDELKLGKGKEMVDKLTELVAIFQRPEFDFKNNKASGDDILGDAYEYLMRKFATESGKSKGQFYTPAEVSRVLAKLIGIDKIKRRKEGGGGWTVYDPACGSGSLLIRAADEAPFEVAIYGQEKDVTTAGLAKMNLVLHNKAAGEIKSGNTFANPQYIKDGELKRFDFAVVNPPFSTKNWTDGIVPYGRFDGYDAIPPERNGDFAWLMHVIKSLSNPNGKAAVILPHGVLFRSNAEASIRKNIIDKGYIEGIIGLPANLFYGTPIAACILVIDKKEANRRKNIFMIDASRDYIKDGNKNRLRERDIKKIVDVYNNRIADDPAYARNVPIEEIKNKNSYNLNISRYIAGRRADDVQNIEAHLVGGIPVADVENLEKYWQNFPKLKNKLYSKLRKGFYQLKIEKDKIADTISNDVDFMQYADKVEAAFENWTKKVDAKLKGIDADVDIKVFIVTLAKILMSEFAEFELIDKYDVYEVLLSYWNETMSDDVYMIKYDGYEAGREIEKVTEEKENKKTGKINIKEVGWEGKLIPRRIIVNGYFLEEALAVAQAQDVLQKTQALLNEFVEEQTADDGYLADFYNEETEKIADKEIKARLKQKQLNKTERDVLSQYMKLSADIKAQRKAIKLLEAALEAVTRDKYAELTVEEIQDLLINKKWYFSIYAGIKDLYEKTCNDIASRIKTLADRYENTLIEIEQQTKESENKVRLHLEAMGFKW